MCLAVPMRISRLLESGRAVVAQGAVEIEVDVSLLSDPRAGDHVIVHAGYAIETLALEEAEQRLALFRRLAELGQGD
jgi:hydrogenase expression/formation protein HypC